MKEISQNIDWDHDEDLVKDSLGLSEKEVEKISEIVEDLPDLPVSLRAKQIMNNSELNDTQKVLCLVEYADETVPKAMWNIGSHLSECPNWMFHLIGIVWELMEPLDKKQSYAVIGAVRELVENKGKLRGLEEETEDMIHYG